MSDKHRDSAKPHVLVALTIAALCAPACSGPQVLPKDPEVIKRDAKACKPQDMEGRLSPFLTDEASGDVRTKLEGVLKTRGVAVVSATCSGIKVLESCQIDGEYSFVGLTPQDKVVVIKDRAEAQANLGFGVGGGLDAAFEAGRELVVKYRMVGKYKTTVPGVVRGQLLSATCRGATHFVTSVDVGAFSSFAAAGGQFKAQGGFAGAGADASASSETSNAFSAGDFDACKVPEASAPDPAPLLNTDEKPAEEGGADAEGEGDAPEAAEEAAPAPVARPARRDDKPPASCGASIRVSLAPVIEVDSLSDFGVNPALAETEEDCRPGFVLNTSDICVDRKDADVYLCNPSDYEECRLMCMGPGEQEAYSLRSCGRLATLLTRHILEHFDDNNPAPPRKECRRERDCESGKCIRGFCPAPKKTNRFEVMSTYIQPDEEDRGFMFAEITTLGDRFTEACETQSDGDACGLAATYKIIKIDSAEEEGAEEGEGTESDPAGDPTGAPEAEAADPAAEKESAQQKQISEFFRLVHKGCHSGDLFSCEVIEIVLVLLTEEEGFAQALAKLDITDTESAMAAYVEALHKSCDQGNSQMCLALARLYVYPKLIVLGGVMELDVPIEANRELAIKYAERSCYGSLSVGCVLSAGLHYDNGAMCHDTFERYDTGQVLGLVVNLAEFNESLVETICGDKGEAFVLDATPFETPKFRKSFDALRTGCSYADATACRLSAKIFQAITLKESDQCPDEAEDFDGYLDSDGCPDEDNDGDGILDKDDKCPNNAETINDRDDEDGCPEVELTGSSIRLGEEIRFARGKADVLKASAALLDDVAGILKANPSLRVSIEGHTDDVGDDKKNKALSQERAESVKEELVGRGIDERRLEAIGYGEEKPKVEIKGRNARKVREARAQNRRVEFRFIN